MESLVSLRQKRVFSYANEEEQQSSTRYSTENTAGECKRALQGQAFELEGRRRETGTGIFGMKLKMSAYIPGTAPLTNEEGKRRQVSASKLASRVENARLEARGEKCAAGPA